MNTSKLNTLVVEFAQIRQAEIHDEAERQKIDHRENMRKGLEKFEQSLSAEALDALTEAGFKWIPVTDSHVALEREGSEKTLWVRMPSVGIVHFELNPQRWYRTSSRREELDLLSEIAFQFGV